MKNIKLVKASNIDYLKTLADNSIDSIVTDPPYELGFMNKNWDASGIAYNIELWKECHRVLKHGGHLIAFSASRTYHWMASAIEKGGFEIRDQLMWMYSCAMPKSLNISKSIDRQSGYIGKVINKQKGAGTTGINENGNQTFIASKQDENNMFDIRELSDEAKKFEGWGTNLKPAHEPMVLARKPIENELTIAENMIKHNTGGINIGCCKVGDDVIEKGRGGGKVGDSTSFFDGIKPTEKQETIGRFPSNIIIDGSDQVKGVLPENGQKYFYNAKCSKQDRNEGLEEFKEKRIKITGFDLDKNGVPHKQIVKNTHPTVKPTSLMAYLVKLVTPKNGTCIDIFNGSGSTGKAIALLNHFENMDIKYTGIDIDFDDEYIPISKARIEYALKYPEATYYARIKYDLKVKIDTKQLNLFDN